MQSLEWTPRKLISLSSNSNENYLFFLPIQAYLLRDFHNLRSLLISVEEDKPWSQSSVLKFYLKWLAIAAEETGGIHVHLNFTVEPGSKWAQLLRYSIASWNQLKDDDILITSDADMAVISKRLLDFHGAQILSTNSFAYGKMKIHGRYWDHLPMCHVGMSVRLWREIFSLPVGNETDVIRETMRIHKMNSKFGVYEDEVYVSLKIGNYTQDHTVDFHRERYKDHPHRIDRGRWPAPLRFTKELIGQARDAHMPRFRKIDEIWPRVVPLFRLLLSEKSLARITEYYNERLSIVN